MPRHHELTLQPSAAPVTSMSGHARSKATASRPNNDHRLHQLVPEDLPKNQRDIPHQDEPSSTDVANMGGCNTNTEASSTDASSSSETDDDEGEDEDEEPAASRPAGSKIASNMKNGIPAGQKKRTFDDTEIGSGHDDEPDYPRKKLSQGMNITQPTTDHLTPTETEDDDDVDFDDVAADEDDEDIEEEEVRAIIEEMEQHEDEFLGFRASTPPQYEFAEDLDSEIFNAQWDGELAPLPYFDSDLYTDNDLFSVQHTPVVTPLATPRGSVSTKWDPMPIDSFTENESSEEDIFDISSLFDHTIGNNKHLVSSYNNTNAGMTDTDSDDAELVKYFFSSDSGNETDGEDTDGAVSDDDEGETTEEEDDLPMPTPRHESKLRRASIASATATRPQVVRMDGSDGLQASSWLADPSRPIIVIEGARQTVILPNEFSNPSAGESDYGSSRRVVGLEESESETTALPPNFDPTLGGLTELDGGMLNGVDFFGPPEAFYPFQPVDGDIQDLLDSIDVESMGDFGIDSGADSGEAELDLDDLLDMSSSEEREAARLEAIIEEAEGEEGDEEEEEDENCAEAQSSSADLLSIWDKVSVTAFRKRQVQHQQKLRMNTGSTNSGYHKGKERRLSETLTPSKKRKVRAKFLANNRGGSSRQRSGR
ncbi:hypothetical protein EX30DRAFT_106875 [Ascodesmis nigricans]|uniref:Uncharacterized protein n=1 Tax=Ascodesmis nigricans TaxID=341454 RepID=A0A4S2N5E8_9PEZI|nr:hypothetical protein EX30DRAFT_106875 [Ascodesmis nigricans]